MNKRITTRGLSELLSVQLGWKKDRAEKFINALSSYIIQVLEKEQSIKVIGLGTFKIVLVRERESVHIKTGERFIIPAHHKLSFIPDKDFKKHINRPFAFLEPVETDENVNYADNETISDDESENTEDEVPVVVIDNDDNTSIDETSLSEDSQLNNDATEEEYSENEDEEEISEEEEDNHIYSVVDAKIEETENTHIPESQQEDAVEEANNVPSVVENKQYENDNDEHKNKKVPQTWIMYILIPLVVLIGTIIANYAFLYYNPYFIRTARTSKSNTPDTTATALIQAPLPIGEIPYDSVTAIASNNLPSEITLSDADSLNKDTLSQTANAKEDTVKKDEKHLIDWLAPARETEETKRADKPNDKIERDNAKFSKKVKDNKPSTASIEKPKQVSGKDKGTSINNDKKATENKSIPARIRMSAGSSLTQIAMEHYGDKVFWVYIYEYNKNRISDFNNIPVGTELRLPSPKTYGIDAKSKASLAKAREKQSKLLKWDNWDEYK